MADLRDSEGEELTITDLEGKKSWEVHVSPDFSRDGEYTGISLAVYIPEQLTDGVNEYNSFGTLVTDLDYLFQEYLDESDGESLSAFINLLSKYTTKATALKSELDKKYGRK